MNAFLTSIPGRILALSVGLNLMVGGIAVLLGPSAGVPWMCIAMIVGVLGAVFATGLGSSAWAKQTLVALFVLPLAFFGYTIALGLAVEYHVTMTGYAFIVAGLLSLSLALLRAPASRSSHQSAYRIAHHSA